MDKERQKKIMQSIFTMVEENFDKLKMFNQSLEEITATELYELEKIVMRAIE